MSMDLFKEYLIEHMESWLTDLKLHQERVAETGHYIHTELSWQAAVTAPNYMESLHQLLRYHPEVYVVWFEDVKGVYQQAMPFVIDHVGVLKDEVLLVMVHGQKSDRIQRKWTIKLEKILGYPVTINWGIG